MVQEQDQLEIKITSLLRAKDQEAISLIYKHYADTLYGFILKIIPSKEAAQDVLQDTFVKIWKNADKYDASKARLFTWFVNIARNTAIDKVRSAQFKRDNKTDSIENFVHKDVTGTEEINVADSGLQKIIQSLDEKHSILIELAYFKGYTQREIEEELGIPLGTIKTRIRSAIIELRKKLGSDFSRNLLTILLTLIVLYYTSD